MKNNAIDGSHDNYAALANLYANVRPSYPTSLVQDFASSVPKRRYALDIAAGSGQLSVPLATHFETVVALDKSEQQLQQGLRVPNIIYHTGLATDLTDATKEITTTTGHSFDAITCAQAYHWFIAENMDQAVLQEACRVLHPGGKLGIFGYGVCTIDSSTSLQKIFHRFYHDDLGSHLEPSSPDCYWEVDRRLLDGGMEDFPAHGLVRVEARHATRERRNMSVPAFLNYVRTFSGLQNLRQKAASQGEIDPMETLQRQFEANSQEDEVLEVDFPFFLIILKPVKN